MYSSVIELVPASSAGAGKPLEMPEVGLSVGIIEVAFVSFLSTSDYLTVTVGLNMLRSISSEAK